MKNWEDDDDGEYCSTARTCSTRPASPTSSASTSKRSTSPPNTRTASSPNSCASTAPAARPTRTCCATPRSSSRRSSTTRWGSAPSASRPGTTPACDEARTAAAQLLKGLDPGKDQSYFLHRLDQAQLARALFPVGELHKTEVRRSPREIGLPNQAKKDSTGICFIGERPFREFLGRYLPRARADPDDRGRSLGEHIGLVVLHARPAQGHRHRRRSRRSAGASLVRGAARTSRATRCTWCRATTIPGCCRARSHAADASWIGRAPRRGPLCAKTRYRQSDAPCALRLRPATARRARLRLAAMGGDARAVGGRLRRRGLPRRRGHRVVGCRQRNTGATAGPT